MSVRLSVRMRGLRDVRAALQRVERVARASAGASARGSAERVAEDMRSFAPVDTGELRDSITVEQVDELTWQAVATAEHAPYVELGTIHMAAQPFMVPAAELERARAADFFASHLTEELG